MNEEKEFVTDPISDGSFVETAFGREDFNPSDEEDKAKRVYRDTSSAKAKGLDPKQVRKWAKENQIEIKVTGKISRHVIQTYCHVNGNPCD